ncbi:MAG: F0F1 ATP synthase subunit epsilon [Cyanobacteria bacterium J06628_6]
MHLKVLIPTQVLVDRPVKAIVAESVSGSFCLLPRHIDLLTALAPGILTFRTADGEEGFLAVDGGILIKCGPEVLISTRNAFWGSRLEDLRQEVEQQFRSIDEQERRARTAIARMEASLARQFTALTAETL